MEKSHTIVVGIDFGTTYTAAAWADASNPAQIEIIQNWPTAGQIVGSQVPSEIAYHHNDRSTFSWGYCIGAHSHKIKWFKLCLELEQDVVELPFDLRPADVVYDFLSAIYKHIMATLHRRVDAAIMQKAVVCFALTVPAVWSDSARKKTQDAASKTGMQFAAIAPGTSQAANKTGIQPAPPPQTFSEPECAAIYALKDLDTIDSLRTKDRILVCDAGGGTVDIITYEILQVNPLSIAECTVGTGDYCGSTFIDRGFEDLFKRRMGSQYPLLPAVVRQQAVKNFEAVKIAFRDDPLQQIFYINLPGIGDIVEARVESGNFQISREEMRELFNPIIDRIVSLIATQIKAVLVINTILLVGGFGESEYLYQRLLSWTSGISTRILQPRKATTAIVRGAVIKGLEKAGFSKTKITRRVRRWYGVIVNESFVDSKHRLEDRCLNMDTGQVLAKNQIRWFIKRVSLQLHRRPSC
ncbi:MAG: hypothetical protein Q9184_004013 [Pyrenodesmia sp. 2 TL-2023]